MFIEFSGAIRWGVSGQIYAGIYEEICEKSLKEFS